MNHPSGKNIVPITLTDEGDRIALTTKWWTPLLVSLIGLIPIAIWIQEEMPLRSWQTAIGVLGAMMVFAGVWMAVHAPRLTVRLGERSYVLTRGPHKRSGPLSELTLVLSTYESNMRSSGARSALSAKMWRLELVPRDGNGMIVWESGDEEATRTWAKQWARRLGIELHEHGERGPLS